MSVRLIRAAQKGDFDGMKDALDKGDDINGSKRGQTILFYVIDHEYTKSEDQLKVLKFLIDNGANVNLLDGNAKSPLDRAIEKNLTDVVNFLKEMNSPGLTQQNAETSDVQMTNNNQTPEATDQSKNKKITWQETSNDRRNNQATNSVGVGSNVSASANDTEARIPSRVEDRPSEVIASGNDPDHVERSLENSVSSRIQYDTQAPTKSAPRDYTVDRIPSRVEDHSQSEPSEVIASGNDPEHIERLLCDSISNSDNQLQSDLFEHVKVLVDSRPTGVVWLSEKKCIEIKKHITYLMVSQIHENTILPKIRFDLLPGSVRMESTNPQAFEWLGKYLPEINNMRLWRDANLKIVDGVPEFHAFNMKVRDIGDVDDTFKLLERQNTSIFTECWTVFASRFENGEHNMTICVGPETFEKLQRRSSSLFCGANKVIFEEICLPAAMQRNDSSSETGQSHSDASNSQTNSNSTSKQDDSIDESSVRSLGVFPNIFSLTILFMSMFYVFFLVIIFEL